MKKNYLKPLLVGCLIGLTCVAIGYANKYQPAGNSSHGVTATNGVLTLAGHLAQDKILLGGDGNVALSLTLTAEDVLNDPGDSRHVDMVIVLDRSGSMRGQKLQHARQAVLDLLSTLTPKDRFALVAYSDGVRRYSNLVKMTPGNRERLESMVGRISASGATNLGGGLQEGIRVLMSARKNGNLGKVVLISDGLANRGIISPTSLGNMVSIAVEKEFAVSTVGVGQDFNEQLMTAIADGGTGNYYYLENPNGFAKVFQKEFHNTRTAAATSVEIRVPLNDGISLVSAAGYPIQVRGNQAIIHPGDIRSGQSKKLFLTLGVPNATERTFEISGIRADYKHKANPYTVTLAEPFQIACVGEQQDVFASIDKEEWGEKVLKDDYNKLREEVAVDIKKGEKKEALKRIETYYQKQQPVNAVVGSSKVSSNLHNDLDELRQMVGDTFQGEPPEVAAKQKRNSKAIQFEAYKERRNSK